MISVALLLFPGLGLALLDCKTVAEFYDSLQYTDNIFVRKAVYYVNVFSV